MNIELTWHGPYSVVRGTKLPSVFEQTEAKQPGVYLWTVQNRSKDMVHYVGKAEQPLRKRLNQEFTPNRTPKYDRCWIPDNDLLRQGIREWIYEPLKVHVPNPKAWSKDPERFVREYDIYTSLLWIYIAPMGHCPEHIRNVETALMYNFWQYEDEHWSRGPDDYYFLCNGAPVPKELNRPYSIQSKHNGRIRGLPERIVKPLTRSASRRG